MRPWRLWATTPPDTGSGRRNPLSISHYWEIKRPRRRNSFSDSTGKLLYTTFRIVDFEFGGLSVGALGESGRGQWKINEPIIASVSSRTRKSSSAKKRRSWTVPCGTSPTPAPVFRFRLRMGSRQPSRWLSKVYAAHVDRSGGRTRKWELRSSSSIIFDI